MSNQDLIAQLLALAEQRDAKIEKARREFERQVEADQQAADNLRQAARVLAEPDQPVAERTLPPEKQAALQEPAVNIPTSKPTFIDIVGDAVRGIGADITTALVFDTLSKAGVQMGDDPRTKISTALARLEKRGTLNKVVEGGIGRPHVYRNAQK